MTINVHFLRSGKCRQSENQVEKGVQRAVAFVASRPSFVAHVEWEEQRNKEIDTISLNPLLRFVTLLLSL